MATEHSTDVLRRKLAVILASDVAGYSALITRDEETTIRRFGDASRLLHRFVSQQGGRVFNTAGDAMLAEFDSAVNAVRCAIDVQDAINSIAVVEPFENRLQLRIGIAIGDVVVTDNGDLLGDGVNIASRLESLAEPGGVCISNEVRHHVQNKIGLGFADLGPQDLKNIPEPVHAYRVLPNGPTPALRPMPPRRQTSALAVEIEQNLVAALESRMATQIYAGFWRRCVATVIDLTLVYVFGFALLLAVALAVPKAARYIDTSGLAWATTERTVVLAGQPEMVFEFGKQVTKTIDRVQTTVLGRLIYLHRETKSEFASTKTDAAGVKTPTTVKSTKRVRLDPVTMAEQNEDLTWIIWPFGLLYASLMEASQRRATLGKMALAIEVVADDAVRISFLRAALRNCLKIVSILPIGIGFMMAGWTTRRQSLHDIMSRCTVKIAR